MNSFCLVAREEIPASSMFQFVDIDRDGMMDMIFSNGLQLNVHYNRLQNELKLYQQSSEGIHLFKAKGICASTVRAINLIKDMFTPPDKATKESGNVQQINIAGTSSAKTLMKVSDSMPGRFHFGDITSDGFPDLVLTVQLQDGKSKSQFFLNRPCSPETCSPKALQTNRRVFTLDFKEN